MKFTEEQFKEFEAKLINRGYRKLNGNTLTHEDFSFWKSFGITRDKYGDSQSDYQIAFRIYDWRKYPLHEGKPFGVNLYFILGGSHAPDRLDMTIQDDSLTVEQLEQVCENFFNVIKQQQWTKRDTQQEPS